MSSEYERKLIDMQYQMRENNTYLNDYMKDLNTWTDEIKTKEENLKKSTNSTSSTTKDLPPVRNFVEPTKPKKNLKRKIRQQKLLLYIHMIIVHGINLMLMLNVNVLIMNKMKIMMKMKMMKMMKNGKKKY